MPLDGNVLQRLSDLNLAGAAFQDKGDYEAARVHYMAALLLAPDNPVVLGNLAGCLYKLSKHEAGIAVGLKAVRLNPNDFLARNNLAINLISVGRCDEAEVQVREAMKLSPPNNAGLMHTRGSLFYRQEKFGDAKKAFEAARALGYDAYAPKNDLAITMLTFGDLSALDLYEVRWEELAKHPVWDLGIPEWKGEDLKGKSIIVHHEQGQGDGIMLCRFIDRMIAVTGEGVTIAVPKSLIRLFKEKFPNQVIFDFRDIPEDIKAHPEWFDFHTPMLSMVRHLGIRAKDIDPKPYLSVPRIDLGARPARFRVGLCWASGDHGKVLEYRRRVVPLESLLPLTNIPGVQVYSLQFDKAQRDQFYELGAEALILDPMAKVEDFYGTAQIIDQLDLVVTVDSAVAHLAGALGKPTVVFEPRPRCWRWWNMPSGLPWYENMRFYTQDHRGSWATAVRHALHYVEDKAIRYGR